MPSFYPTSMISPSVSLPSHLQHKCTTSHSCIPSSCLYLCFPPLYAFFGRSALRAEFSSTVRITKYYYYYSTLFYDNSRYTRVWPAGRTERVYTSVCPASPKHDSPVMSFAYLIFRACRRSWQPKTSEGGISELSRGRGASYDTLSWTRKTTSVLNQYADPPST